MESVANFTTLHHHNRLPLTLTLTHHHHRLSLSKPISSLSFPTQFPSLKFSSSSSSIKSSFSNPPSHKPSLSPLKTALISTVTATAIFLASQLNLKPLLATPAPPPPATVETESVTVPKMDSVIVTNLEEGNSKSVVTDTDLDSVLNLETEKNPDQSIGSNPKDVEALRNLMEIKLKDVKLDEALVLLEELMILDPNNEDWLILRAYIYIQIGDHEVSKKTFHGIISKDPFKIEAYHGLVVVASQKESEMDLIEAEGKIKDGLEKAKMLKKKLLEREFNVLLAQVMVIKGDYDNALRIYKDLIKKDPKDFRPYLCQGIIYTMLKKDVDAEASFEKYRSLVPKGHPHGEYFENNMRAAKLFVQKEENKKSFSKR